jgi:hypothetical protein
MSHPVVRIGWATLLCAVLSGVQSAELQDAAVVDDVVSNSQMELVAHVRRLSTNSTSDGLSTGSLVAIIAGSAAGVVLLAGLVWWGMCRKPPMYKPAEGGYAPMRGGDTPLGEIEVPDSRELPPNFFRTGAVAEQSQLPLLRLPVA